MSSALVFSHTQVRLCDLAHRPNDNERAESGVEQKKSDALAGDAKDGRVKAAKLRYSGSRDATLVRAPSGGVSQSTLQDESTDKAPR